MLIANLPTTYTLRRGESEEVGIVMGSSALTLSVAKGVYRIVESSIGVGLIYP